MFDQKMAAKAVDNLTALRKKKPLIHNITNYVVMNYTANALLACGASPVMAHAREEVAEMVSFAGALVLNIGTLTPAWVDSIHHGLITRLILEQGGLPESFSPFIPSGAESYHSGFHSNLATYIWLTDLEIHTAMQFFGQVLNALMGFPIYLSEWSPNVCTTQKYVAILGDFSFYFIADAMNVQIQRLTELYAETNQTGFI